MLPSVHRVRRVGAGGKLTEYWYAWRSGPRILKVTAANDTLLGSEIIKQMPKAIKSFEALKRPDANKAVLTGLITFYLASAEFRGLAPRTQRDRRIHLDRVRMEIGALKLKAFEAPGARSKLLQWRERFSDTPKTADELLGSLSIVLTWGLDQGHVPVNPIAGFRRLYKSNRADVIWTPSDLEKIRPHCSPRLWQAIELARLTGARLGDLRELSWAHVGTSAITWQTRKSNRRSTVVVPITDELRRLLGEIPRGTSTVILNSSLGRPWTEPGLETAFRKAKEAAGISGLRWHDLRGTAATEFVRAGLHLDEVAMILGWQTSKVDEIAKRYVTAEAKGKAMIDRLEKNKPRTKAVK